MQPKENNIATHNQNKFEKKATQNEGYRKYTFKLRNLNYNCLKIMKALSTKKRSLIKGKTCLHS